MPLAGQVHSCWKCSKRLPVDNVAGSVVALCPHCKQPNQIVVAAPPQFARERC
jgi:phage FluMu protein Com